MEKFIVGAKYKVIKALNTPLDNFSKDEVVNFSKQSYSRYDSASIYTFQATGSSEYKQAFIQDTDNIDLTDYFCKL